MGGIGSLSSTCQKEIPLTGECQYHVEQHLFGLALDQARPEFTQHGAVEAGIGQGQSQGIFPVDPATDCLGCLAVGQALGELKQSHQRKPPWRLRRPAPCREQTSKAGIVEYRAQFIP